MKRRTVDLVLVGAMVFALSLLFSIVGCEQLTGVRPEARGVIRCDVRDTIVVVIGQTPASETLTVKCPIRK